MNHHFTVDVEAPEHLCRLGPADYRPSEVLRDVEEWLEFLAEAGVRATFFILGEIVQREPAVARRIAAAGHETASHGHRHRPVHRLTEAEFREDLARSRGVLEDAVGRTVRGYRSPAWTLGRAPSSYREIVFEAGYAYSSSLLPATGFMGARGEDPREYSPCVWRCGPVAVPAGTSWMFRLMPAIRMARHLEKEERHVLVAHAHELVQARPASALGAAAAFIRYAGTEGWREKLRGLLAPHAWTPLESLLP